MVVDYKRRVIKWTIRQFLLLMIVAWMFVIFGFSSEDGEQSQSLSDKITYRVVQTLYPKYEQYEKAKQEKIWNDTSYAVRKTGHFGEYAVLGLLIATLMLTFSKVRNNMKLCMAAEGFCAVYAMTDEIHQGFVAGRSPKIFDVFIDSLGAGCGIATAVVVCIIIMRIVKSKEVKCPKAYRKNSRD